MRSLKEKVSVLMAPPASCSLVECHLSPLAVGFQPSALQMFKLS